jgi:hypothetical protein
MSPRKSVYRWDARNWDTNGSVPHRLVYVEAGSGTLQLCVPSRKGLTVQSILMVGAPLWYAIGLPYVLVTAINLSGFQRLTGLILDAFLLVIWPVGAVLVAFSAWRWGMAYAARESSGVFFITEIRSVSLGRFEHNMSVVANGEEINLTLTARAKSLRKALRLAGYPID